MTLIIESEGDCLQFNGSLNRDTLMQYSPFTLLNNGAEKVRFDFAKLDSIDTAGLAWLLQQLAIAKQQGRVIQLCKVPEQLLSLADVTAVRPLLPISE